MTFSLLYVWIDGVDTIRVVFPANFSSEFPYDPFELISFAILGYYFTVTPFIQNSFKKSVNLQCDLWCGWLFLHQHPASFQTFPKKQ